MNIFIIFMLIAIAAFSIIYHLEDRRALISHLIACLVILFISKMIPFFGLILGIIYVVTKAKKG